ncbi:MAG: GH92 family glycosyl hydrolase [Bacteroidia bacterium]|nr:GH92 family glycosyl hydrolase [Bacteroidia bacterium]
MANRNRSGVCRASVLQCAMFVALILVSATLGLPAQEIRYTEYVNPFIGTDRMGHTFPGAVAPFGFVQLSPDTDTISYEKDGAYNPRVYEYCAGYQYRDSTIVGFSHTHFSGTGRADLGDFLIMPTTGEVQLNPGIAQNPDGGYRSRFSHDTESAGPGYYRVRLDDYAIVAELTATERVGFHRYTFERGGAANIILDLMHGIYNTPEKNVWTFVRVENERLITGYRMTSGWARTRVLYFAMEFDTPFSAYGHRKYDTGIYRGFYRKFDESKNFPEMAGRQLRAYFSFDTREGETVQIKFALSAVSTEGALNNLRTETPDWDFSKTRAATSEQWNRELARVHADFLSDDDRTVFYTALYHSFISPSLYEDVDGSYRGLDQSIHRSEGFTNYSTFSLWDTYRALHPLFTLLQPTRTNDMIESMLAHQQQSVHGMLPVWSHHANENWCMIGYHAVSVIADAAVKGVYTGDLKRALDACVATATYGPYDGIAEYMQRGYVPQERSRNSVSMTLEYAYDDWAISRLAALAGNSDAEDTFRRRSGFWRHCYDPSIGFMRPKSADGVWMRDFDPLGTHGQGFIEGNAWNYGLYVPHDVEGLIARMGGQTRFTAFLDSLFVMHLDDRHFEHTEDITRDGIIGSYVHGNEPGHHIPYLYNWTASPWKTETTVRMILDSMYANRPDGLCGNDDCGQMSAWYIFSALGFYPVAPGSDRYYFGSPLVRSARIHFENGNMLTITASQQKRENVHVRDIILNGRSLGRRYITHAELTEGGELEFVMGNAEFGTQNSQNKQNTQK